MRSLIFKNFTVVFIFLLFFVGLTDMPFSNVSAQYIDSINNRGLETPPNSDDLGPTNRIIVKYKSGQSPKDLKTEVDRRSAHSASFYGQMSLAVENVILGLTGQDTPEVKLDRINEVKISNNLKEEMLFKDFDSFVEGVFVYTKQENISPIDQIVSQYEGLEEVDYAEIDGYIYTSTNDTYYNLQWGMDMIQAPAAWNIEKGDTSGNVLIAVIDTGINWDHVDLNDKIVAVYDCRTNISCARNFGRDFNGHGTHVSGIAAAETNNSQGVAGAGYNTKLISIQVLNSNGSGYTSWSATALYQLMSAYPNKKIVINMSLTSDSSLQVVQDAIAAAHNQGFIIVAAAGNGDDNGIGISTMTYPAAYSNVVAVAALDKYGNKSMYSNFSPTWVDVAAPGGGSNCINDSTDCIVSSYYSTNSQYGYMAGTSQASPHVAGVAALVWAKNPTFTNTQVENAIFNSATVDSGKGTYWKYGKLNAAAALAPPAATSTPTPTYTPIPTSTPTLTPIPPTPTTAPAPDLIVESIEVIDSQTGPAGTYDIMVTIKNQGKAAAGFHRNYLYLNPVDQPPILTTDETSTGARSDNIPPGTSYEWGIIENTFDQTDYAIYAWTNRDEGLVESDYENNQLMFNFTVPDPTETPIPTATPTPVDACPLFSLGDANCDNFINSTDYGVWYTEYFCTIDGDSNCTNGADFDKNGVVNLFDFTILISGIRYRSSN